MQTKVLRLNERQKLFFMARRRFIGYGGARGGGKTWSVRMKAMLLASRYAGIKILIVRRSFQEPVSYTHLDVYKRQAQTPCGVSSAAWTSL